MKLEDLQLRHIDPSKLLLQRTDIVGGVIPSWFEEASSGSFGCEGWYGGSVLATIETKHQHRLYVAVVAVSGLFANDELISRQTREKDDTLLREASQEEMEVFSRRAIADIYPFLRMEVYALTGKFQGLPGVMLQPEIVIGERKDRTGVAEIDLPADVPPEHIKDAIRQVLTRELMPSKEWPMRISWEPPRQSDSAGKLRYRVTYGIVPGSGPTDETTPDLPNYPKHPFDSRK